MAVTNCGEKVYTLYETTNKESGCFYVGVHGTTNVDDKYMGSGTIIKKAVERNPDRFHKTVIGVFKTADEAYHAEKLIVNEDFVRRDDTYNLVTGGKHDKKPPLIPKNLSKLLILFVLAAVSTAIIGALNYFNHKKTDNWR